jgi:hypothetical protein
LKNESHWETQNFNVEKPRQQREEKPWAPDSETSLYRELFTNEVDYLMMQ